MTPYEELQQRRMTDETLNLIFTKAFGSRFEVLSGIPTEELVHFLTHDLEAVSKVALLLHDQLLELQQQIEHKDHVIGGLKQDIIANRERYEQEIKLQLEQNLPITDERNSPLDEVEFHLCAKQGCKNPGYHQVQRGPIVFFACNEHLREIEQLVEREQP